MNTSAYSGKAQDYALYRPKYSDNAIRALFEITGFDYNWIVADIGSGTGNVSRHLVERVKQVYAIEPDRAMRSQAERLLGNDPSFRSIDATAEHTTLPDHCLDLIIVGQALHWFDWPEVKNEFNRILKPGGWVSLIWNQFKREKDQEMPDVFLPGTYQQYSFSEVLHETWPQFLGGMRSAANNPNKDDDGYEEFEKQVREIFNSRAIAGWITVEYTTELAVGRLIK